MLPHQGQSTSHNASERHDLQSPCRSCLTCVRCGCGYEVALEDVAIASCATSMPLDMCLPVIPRVDLVQACLPVRSRHRACGFMALRRSDPRRRVIFSLPSVEGIPWLPVVSGRLGGLGVSCLADGHSSHPPEHVRLWAGEGESLSLIPKSASARSCCRHGFVCLCPHRRCRHLRPPVNVR